MIERARRAILARLLPASIGRGFRDGWKKNERRPVISFCFHYEFDTLWPIYRFGARVIVQIQPFTPHLIREIHQANQTGGR